MAKESPWAISVDRTHENGFALVTFCVKCEGEGFSHGSSGWRVAQERNCKTHIQNTKT
jgi:hypothetical protein